MAYGLRIRIEYRNINEVLTRINIFKRNYAGNADVRFAHAGIRIDYGDAASLEGGAVYGSSCTVFFDAEADYEYSYLFSSDALEHLVEVEEAGVLIWRGYIEPDSGGEPLTPPPYPVEFTAYDRLGFLKDEPFVDENGDAYTGRKTWLEIVQICLAKTGLSMTLNSCINWSEQLQTAGLDVLAIHKKDCDAFYDMSCYDVLTELLRKCRVLQRSGMWWVISESNFRNDTIGYFRYPIAGGSSTGTVSIVAPALVFDGSSPAKETLPGLKFLNVFQDFGYRENLVENGSFDQMNDAGEFENWTKNSVVTQQRDLNADGDKFVLLNGMQYQQYYPQNQTKSISTSIRVKATSEFLKFGFRYALMGAAGSCSKMFIRVRLTGDNGTNYSIVQKLTPPTSEREYEWRNDATPDVNWWKWVIALKSHYNLVQGYPVADYVPAYPFHAVLDHFETFLASIETIPTDGLLTFYLYVPYTDDARIAGSCFTGFNTSLLNYLQETYETGRSIRATISQANNYVPEDFTLAVGDIPSPVNSNIIYRGGFTRLDASLTTGWKIAGDPVFYTYAEFIARHIAAEQARPRQNYKIRIADVSPSLNLVFVDAHNSNIRLVENGVSYDSRMQCLEGQYTEIIDLNLETPSVSVVTETSSKSGSSSSSGGRTQANPKSIDERVSLMNTEGGLTSSPGFLDNRYFEFIQLDSGHILIRSSVVESGRITGLASASVTKSFLIAFDVAPVGRGLVRAYREIEPETGKTMIQDVLYHSFAFTTTDGLITGFELTIDETEDLSGVIIEYCFTKNFNNL